MELLAPAGSMEALRAAVCNGADAVYLGADTFNARMNARNFSAADLQEAVVYCHVRGVKVHLTLNTLVLDREMPRAAELIRLAASCGVDAFIVQDLGVVSLCRQLAPDVPIHASTQMSIHSLEGVLEAAALGCSVPYLAHTFKDATGYSPIQYAIRRRIGLAQTLLISTDHSATRIATMVGYDNTNYFNSLFTRIVGTTPIQYRKKYLEALRGERNQM